MADHIVSVDDNYNFPAPVIDALEKKLANANAGSLIRIDTTVGKRIFINDGIKEHMVHGDTGWSLVTLAENSAILSGSVEWNREGNDVRLRLNNVILKPGAGYISLGINIPVGYRQRPNDRVMQFIGMTANATALQVMTIFTGTISWVNMISGVNITNTRPTGDGLQGTLSWVTADPWPTVLPK